MITIKNTITTILLLFLSSPVYTALSSLRESGNDKVKVINISGEPLDVGLYFKRILPAFKVMSPNEFDKKSKVNDTKDYRAELENNEMALLPLPTKPLLWSIELLAAKRKYTPFRRTYLEDSINDTTYDIIAHKTVGSIKSPLYILKDSKNNKIIIKNKLTTAEQPLISNLKISDRFF